MVDGILEGYQTYDALAGMVMGGVIIISLNAQGFESYQEKKKIIAQSGVIAMTGLLIIYTGLIALGAHYNMQFSDQISRTDLLLALSKTTLGSFGAVFTSVLMALACFTTAVAITVAIADFFKVLFKGSEKAYTFISIVCCIIGVIMGSYEVGLIIDIAIPALMFIYPISIVLIILNILPEEWTSVLVFRAVVITAFVFSIPDVLVFFMTKASLSFLFQNIPLASYNLGWVLPSVLVFVMVNLVQRLRMGL